jgi:predicted nucleic acid-binding protein
MQVGSRLTHSEHSDIFALFSSMIALAQLSAEIAADYALRGADAVYVAVARRYNCTLVSLDREQRERAAALVQTRTPADALAELPPASV